MERQGRRLRLNHPRSPGVTRRLPKVDRRREQRILEEIVVDAYTAEEREQAMLTADLERYFLARTGEPPEAAGTKRSNDHRTAGRGKE